MKVLIVGTGGREHALLWKLQRDAPEAEFLCTAGNAGMEEAAEPVAVSPHDVSALLRVARERAVDLTVVGPEAPLAAGIADAFAAAGLAVFGPRRVAAEIECSKAFAKAFMRRHGIPTADFRTFTDPDAARAYLETAMGPVVVKASGLAGGKGAIVCESREEAVEVADAMLRRGAFGEAGREVVIEERLWGPELSVIALSDGETVRPLLPARDHKRALDGDRGANTGGMGAIAPVPDVPADLVEEIAERVLRPAVRGLAAEGRLFRGALYAGLMLTPQGPRVVEFNARFGDPETQAILPLLETSLLDLLRACAEPGPAEVPLAQLDVRWRAGAACCVVAAAAGYPGSYERGAPIDLGGELRDDEPPAPGGQARSGAASGRVAVSGPLSREPRLDASHGRGVAGTSLREICFELPPREAAVDAASGESVLVFHAGTARKDDRLVTAGGRVLGVTGLGPDPQSARAAAYRRLARISFAGMHYRTDIGLTRVRT